MVKSYVLKVVINNIEITELVIGDHYKQKHADITDDVIIELVTLLDGKRFIGQKSDSYEYFKSEFELKNKLYRLIWILEENKVYVGVVNVFRISKRSK